MAERKRTNAEIDLLNSVLKDGETKLPYELDENNNLIEKIETPENKTPENKVPELDENGNPKEKELTEEDKKILAEEKRLEKEKEENQKNLIAQAEEEKDKLLSKNAINPVTVEEQELDDDKILAYLKNKKGKELTSLDDLLNPKKELTEEEKQELKEKRESEKIAFGLSKGIFSKKQLEEFISDTKNPESLVLAAYVADQKQKDDTLTDAEITEEFNSKFGLNEDKDSREYQAGQTIINNLADNILRKKHSKILNLESEYSAHESYTQKQKETEAKILANTSAYKKDVDNIKNEIKKVSINVGDSPFEFELDDKVVNDITSKMLSSDYASQQISSGWNKETIRQVAQTTAIIENLPAILKQYADREILKKQAGVRGIPPASERGERKQEGELSDRQKEALNYFKGETVAN